jgi:hypothetical protein
MLTGWAWRVAVLDHAGELTGIGQLLEALLLERHTDFRP